MVVQQQITGAKPKFPKFLSSNALSLLKGLLTRDPAQRLGGGPDGAAAIKRHPFFRGLSWSALEARQLESKFKPGVKCSLARQLESKFKPGVKCSLSVENFDKIWTEQRPVDSPCGTPTDPAYAGAFEGFTYVAPSFMASSMEAWGAAKAAQQQQQQQQ
uniref:AGC-kinase C-terminal domain-containing protein n=1 Tax=Tetradesmus obliquus TaxID=3088 RepID=A0A383WMG2_TETOB